MAQLKKAGPKLLYDESKGLVLEDARYLAEAEPPIIGWPEGRKGKAFPHCAAAEPRK